MLKRINYLLSSLLPPKAYWYIAGLINPFEAVIEKIDNPVTFYNQGKDLVKLLQKLKLISNKSKVLDIGCGTGRLEYSLAKYIKFCLAVDISASMIKLAKKYVKETNIKFKVTNGKDLKGIKNNQFSLIFSILVFQHIPKDIFLNYLSDSYNLLEKGGILFFQIPLYWDQKPQEPPPNHPWALRHYRLIEIQNILKKLNFAQIKFFDGCGNRFSGKPNQVFIQATKA